MGKKSLFVILGLVLLGAVMAPFIAVGGFVMLVYGGGSGSGNLASGDSSSVVFEIPEGHVGVFVNPSMHSPTHVTSQYGMRKHPVLGTYRMHEGADYRAYCGTSVVAGADGVVMQAGPFGGLGNAVVIEHQIEGYGTLRTVYGHLQSTSVVAGQHLVASQLIGLAGNTGTSTSCHLHFEVRVGSGATFSLPTTNPLLLTGRR